MTFSLAENSSSAGAVASVLEDPVATGALEGNWFWGCQQNPEAETAAASGTKWLCGGPAVEVMLLPATRGKHRGAVMLVCLLQHS